MTGRLARGPEEEVSCADGRLDTGEARRSEAMSYDVCLREDCCATCGRGEQVFESNYTSNMGAAWREAGIAIHDWQNKRAGEVLAELDAGIEAIEADRDRFKRHEPVNGWGSVSSMLTWLNAMADAFRENPNAMIRVSR